jgi:ammonium transporter, Amt family
MRKKNTVSIILQILLGLTIMSFLWHMFGFSFAKNPMEFSRINIPGVVNGTLFGNPFANFFLNGIDDCFRTIKHIPSRSIVTFTMMFASITPLLLTGTFGERIKLRTFLLFIIIWEITVYYPIYFLFHNFDGFFYQLGARDYAGGITIHAVVGFSALLSAIIVKSPDGGEDTQAHNIPLGLSCEI